MKIPSLKYTLATAVAVASSLIACQNGDTTIGSGLVGDEQGVVIADSFPVIGHSIPNQSIQGRTITQLLGSIQAKGYGDLSSDFVTQFMPAQKLSDSLSLESFDSIRLSMAIPMGAYVGDSVAPMGLEVYRLNRVLPFPIYSDFNPADYYDPSALVGNAMYACNATMATDSVQKLAFRRIDVKLPDELGRELLTLYKEKPEAYSVPSEFAKSFPGLYVKNSYGSGRVVKVGSTVMQVFYHTWQVDSIKKPYKVPQIGTYFAVTPEIVTNNNIDFVQASALTERVDSGQQLLVAPAGMDVELTFPTRQVIDYYRDNGSSLSVLNTLTFTVPVEEITNDYSITPPDNVLLVLSSEKNEFFRKNDVTNDKTSFVGTYDSYNKQYTFSSMRNYLVEMLKKDTLEEKDYTFTLTPVSLSTETSGSNYYYGTSTTYVNAITPYVETPAMCRLLLDKATVKLTFTTQTVR